MKKLVIAIMAGMMMTATCFAQNNDSQQRPQRMDKNEMIKMRTDRMVTEYGLDEEQAAKLKDLNTSFADKLPNMGGPRQMGPRDRNGNGNGRGMRRGGQNLDGNSGAPEQVRERPSREEMEARMKEMRTNMEAYNAELKKIMTEEQFQKYQENSSRRMGGPRPGGRGGRNSNQ